MTSNRDTKPTLNTHTPSALTLFLSAPFSKTANKAGNLKLLVNADELDGVESAKQSMLYSIIITPFLHSI